MSYWTPITPPSDSLKLVDLQENEILEKNKSLFHSFERHLIDVYKEGNLVFVYRGESFKCLRKRLFLSNEDSPRSKLYERLFIIGDKARYFFMDKEDSNNRGWLTNINDRSAETFGFIFDRISNALSDAKLEFRIQQACSSRFLIYFHDSNNRGNFVNLVENCTKDDDKNRLKLRDYYLYFLHVAGSSGIRKEAMLVSTSLSVGTSEGFAGKNDKDIRDKLILCGFIPQPYHNFIVSPWLASEYHKIASENSLPTYQPFGLHPEQLEVSVKGALFPCFILGIKQVEDEYFVVNPHVFNVQDLDDASKHGIPVQQNDFMTSILSSNYMRFISTNLQGDFEQYELPH